MKEFFGQSYFVPFLMLLLVMVTKSSGMRLPVSQVRIRIRRRMLSDVVGRGVARRIARHKVVVVVLVLVLVDANVIEAHLSWQIGRDLLEIDGGETVRHAKIGDDGHGLLGNDSRADVAVGPC